jgi:hypothetical protein
MARGNALSVFAVAIAIIVVVVAALAIVLRSSALVLELPPERTSRIEVHKTPNVILAVRELSRLEGASFHIEKVVELSDEQTRIFGLVRAKDAILLVAVGDVVAGVDLATLEEKDVTVEATQKRVVLRLASPEIFSAAIDNAKTHVYARATDRFASRREDLEGLARTEAEAGMRRAAVEGGILEKTKTSVARTLHALATSLGFEDVRVEWK